MAARLRDAGGRVNPVAIASSGARASNGSWRSSFSAQVVAERPRLTSIDGEARGANLHLSLSHIQTRTYV